jgi:hypothetical protein
LTDALAFGKANQAECEYLPVMSTRAARREYLDAVAEFQRALQEFSVGMGRVLDPSLPNRSPQDGTQPAVIAELLGPRKPAQRAPRARRLIAGARKA